jgi:hypothetical protein
MPQSANISASYVGAPTTLGNITQCVRSIQRQHQYKLWWRPGYGCELASTPAEGEGRSKGKDEASQHVDDPGAKLDEDVMK